MDTSQCTIGAPCGLSKCFGSNPILNNTIRGKPRHACYDGMQCDKDFCSYIHACSIIVGGGSETCCRICALYVLSLVSGDGNEVLRYCPHTSD